MRVYAVALLGTAALPICVSSSLGLNETVVDASTGVRTNVGVHSTGPVDRPVKMRSTTDEKDKMPQDLAPFVSGEQRDMLPLGIVLKKVKGSLYAKSDVYGLASGAFDHLKQIDSHVLPQIVEDAIARCKAGGFHLHKKEESIQRDVVLRRARDSVDGEKHLVQAILNWKKQANPVYHQVGPNLEAEQGHAIADKLRSEKSEPMHTGHESLDSLLAAFGGAAELAPILSIAKKSKVVGHRAEELQRVMLKSWLEDEPDVVFKWLKLSDLGERGVTYENLDTFAQYIDLRNEVYGEEEDVLSFLREEFTDSELAMMILKGTGPYKDIEEPYVWDRDEGISDVDFVVSILNMAVRVDTLLDPLLAATGGASRLAPILLAVKRDPIIGFRAELLQNAMFKRWLESGEFVGNVYDLLKLSELRGGRITSENMYTWTQYIRAYDEKHGERTDVPRLLRMKLHLGDLAQRSMEIPETSTHTGEGHDRQHVGDGISAVDFVSSILFLKDDVDLLLEELLSIFGSAARLAPILSTAKMNPVIRTRVERLQNAMLKDWLEKQPDVVFKWLELSNLGQRGVTYENLDTFMQYFKLRNEVYGTKKEDMLSVLREEFTDIKLAMMILEGTGPVKNIRDGHVWRSMGDGISAVDFVGGILFFARSADMLLDPLLAAFGGAAKLVPVLLSTKMKLVVRPRAKELHSAMLTRWLDRGKSVRDAFDLLQINNIEFGNFPRADDIFEQYSARFDSYKEYIKLYNERHGTDMDVAQRDRVEKLEKEFASEREKRKREAEAKRKGISQPAARRNVRPKRLG